MHSPGTLLMLLPQCAVRSPNKLLGDVWGTLFCLACASRLGVLGHARLTSSLAFVMCGVLLSLAHASRLRARAAGGRM